MNKKVILTNLILMLVFATNAQTGKGNSKKIVGNGKVITLTRATSGYDGIAIGGTFDVILVKGTEGNLSIEGEENIIPYIETHVERGVLKIRYKRNINLRTTKKIRITIPFKDINSVALGGSAQVRSEELIKSTNFKVSLGGSGNVSLKVDAAIVNTSIGGSGNIKLEGNANKLDCSIAGSGSVKAYDLTTTELNVNIAGSGSMEITVTSKITSKLIGSGNVYYKGNPKIYSKAIGSGKVVNRN